MVLGLTALFLLVTGLYFVVSNGAFCPLCQDYFISNGETYIWDTRGGYLEPLSVYRHCHSDGVSMLDIRTGMHSECSSTARTGIVRFADDPGPILSTASATGRTSLWAASRCWTRTRTTRSSGGSGKGGRSGGGLFSHSHLGRGSGTSGRSISPGDPFPLDFSSNSVTLGGISEPRRLLHGRHPSNARPGAGTLSGACTKCGDPHRRGCHHPFYRPLPQGAPRLHGRPAAAPAGGPPSVPAEPGGPEGGGRRRYREPGQAHPGALRRHRCGRHSGGGGGPVPPL